MQRLVKALEAKGLKLALAESCTGGMIAAAVTDISGSSAVFDRGFVTYSNQAKTDMLGVRPETLAQYGAVSEQTAREMALGALDNSQADIALSVTGIAGPDGGSTDKPVGLVYIGLAIKGGSVEIFKNNFSGNRNDVRRTTVEKAKQLLQNVIA